MIRQNFNADWTVEKGDGNSRMNSFLGNTQTKTVHLPYDAMIHEARTPDTKNGAQTAVPMPPPTFTPREEQLYIIPSMWMPVVRVV